MFQRLVDEETGAAPWEAESMPAQVAEAYQTLEYLRQKQRAGNFGSSAHDFRQLERARRIVAQWEAENSVPVVEIEVKTEEAPQSSSDVDEMISEDVQSDEALGFHNGLAVNDDRPTPEPGPPEIESPAIEPEESRPMPEASPASQSVVRMRQAFVAGIIMDARRPVPEVNQYVATPLQAMRPEHAAELQSLREAIRAARAELELLEHRLSALINSEL
jgi:hypothetical protein